MSIISDTSFKAFGLSGCSLRISATISMLTGPFNSAQVANLFKMDMRSTRGILEGNSSSKRPMNPIGREVGLLELIEPLDSPS